VHNLQENIFKQIVVPPENHTEKNCTKIYISVAVACTLFGCSVEIWSGLFRYKYDTTEVVCVAVKHISSPDEFVLDEFV